MRKRKTTSPKKATARREQPSPAEIQLRPAGEVVVTAQEEPPTQVVKKVIHERRFPPRTPEAPARKTKDETSRT
jgi:hypothetical protein